MADEGRQPEASHDQEIDYLLNQLAQELAASEAPAAEEEVAQGTEIIEDLIRTAEWRHP